MLEASRSAAFLDDSSMLMFLSGLRVFATARNPDAMADLASIGITTLALDVTDAEALRGVREHIAEKTGGKLDILVNNACVSCLYFLWSTRLTSSDKWS